VVKYGGEAVQPMSKAVYHAKHSGIQCSPPTDII